MLRPRLLPGGRDARHAPGHSQPGCRIVAVDAAPAMIERCREIFAEDDRQTWPETRSRCGRRRYSRLQTHNASMVVLNYTLQFLADGDRDALMRSIYAGMNDGGLLVLSEKVVDENPSHGRAAR